MVTKLNSTVLMRRSLPAHSYHPNASLMASGRKGCYVANPNRYKVASEIILK